MKSEKKPGEQWAAEVTDALIASGFTVDHLPDYPMFPLVKMPADLDGTIRLMKLRLPWACERRIIAEGMLFLPVFAEAAR